MQSAEDCRAQSGECHRLSLSADSEAEATVLRNLGRTWVTIANQIDRHAEITKDKFRSERYGSAKLRRLREAPQLAACQKKWAPAQGG
jgi:hypothetical protein